MRRVIGNIAEKKEATVKFDKFNIENLGDKLNGLVSKKSAFLITIIILASFAVYFNSLSNGFVYDDTDQILENNWIKDVHFIPAIFTSSVWGFQSAHKVSNYYRPMMQLIYMLNYHIFGLTPWGFHLVNILFHAGVSVLVFIIARRLLARSQRSEATPALPAFAAALLFATHPIHTEAVAWVAGLPDLSYTFFCLLSFYLYMKSEEGARRMYLLSVASFAVSTLCKEPALMLPFILMAYDLVGSARKQNKIVIPQNEVPRIIFSEKDSGQTGMTSKKQLIKFIQRYIPYFAIALAYMGLRLHALGSFSPRAPYVMLSAYGYIINIFPLFAVYLEKLLLPLNLNAFHVFHPISSIFEVKGIVSLAITAAFIALIVGALKKNRMVFFSLLIIALPLLPSLYIRVVGENVFAERYLYLPSFGFALLVVALFLFIKTDKLSQVLGLCIIIFALAVAYSIQTINRNEIWKDNLTLFEDTVEKSPEAAIPQNYLGIAYEAKGLKDKAIEHFQTALLLDPNLAAAYINLAKIYDFNGLSDKAVELLQTALRIEPDSSVAYNDLGLLYAEREQFDLSIVMYDKAIAAAPSNYRAYINRGNAYDENGRFDKAFEDYNKAISINPSYAGAYFDRGLAYLHMKRLDLAKLDFQTACDMKYNRACELLKRYDH